jgi:hypothetical protein
MANKKWIVVCVVLAVLVLLAVATVQAGPESQRPGPQGGVEVQAALGTGFTYQGQLKSGGRPVDDTCDFQFGLWDALTGGGQLGVTQTVSISVTSGLFTTQLNGGGEFGYEAFRGAARWLAIAVRCPAGSGDYTSLSPRQEVTGVPYAHALIPGSVIKNTEDISGWTPGIWLESTNGSAVVGRNYIAGGACIAGDNMAGGNGVSGWTNSASGSSTAGVVGTNAGSGYAIKGVSVGGVAGRFETNSSIALPTVLLYENADDYARLTFQNDQTEKFWTIAGYASVTDTLSRLNVWNSSTGDLVSISGDGKVGIGIGTTAPAAKLEVSGGSGKGVYGRSSGTGVYGVSGAPSGMTTYSSSGAAVWGDSTSGAPALAGTVSQGAGVYGRSNGSTPTGWYYGVYGTAAGGVGVHGATSTGTGVEASTDSGDLFVGCVWEGLVFPSCNPKFRVDSAGKGFFNGGYQTGGADMAEFITASGDPQPGDVVEIDPQHPGQFRLAATPNSTAVAGVISTDPGASLGASDPAGDENTGPQLALVGRVPVKVSVENGAIRPGDLLVASSTPGHAMRAPADPAPGTVIGKALRGLDSGTGVVEMLVMLR